MGLSQKDYKSSRKPVKGCYATDYVCYALDRPPGAFFLFIGSNPYYSV